MGLSERIGVPRPVLTVVIESFIRVLTHTRAHSATQLSSALLPALYEGGVGGTRIPRAHTHAHSTSEAIITTEFIFIKHNHVSK